ncbi:diguanylate cyclase [Paludibacterium denitrificans]|uniref:diguanylate cyclase n=1 Tax=Paludibacterium denitrificans TaxID=2675226 RepID=UPI001E2A5494|nr:diguanylate cyclase [Paludibacterium denitrificans]
MSLLKRALIIEDSSTLIRPLCRMAEEQGFEAVAAMTFAEAQQAFADNPQFSVAVADYCLPDATDGEALEWVLQQGIPTIVMTSRQHANIHHTILQRPVVDYIPKESPSAPEYLSRLLRRIYRNPEICVLVVDDSQAARGELCSYLHRHCYRTRMASNAEEALRALHEDPSISLVLADYNMPDIDGIQMTSTIRRFTGPNRIAIVGISGSGSPDLTPRFLKWRGRLPAKTVQLRRIHLPGHAQRGVRGKPATLEHIAHADPLTGLSNRRHFFEEVQKMRGDFGIGMLDIDHFKQINDTFGHDVGDMVICQVADTLRHFPGSLIARFGGEEFVVVMERDPLHPLAQRLEELRREVAAQVRLQEKGDLRFTVSGRHGSRAGQGRARPAQTG